MVSSTWRIESRTASIARSALSLSSAHNSTVIRVPMMPSVTRRTHSACAGNAKHASSVKRQARVCFMYLQPSVVPISECLTCAARPAPPQYHYGTADHAAQVSEVCDSRKGTGDAHEKLHPCINRGEQPRRHRDGWDEGHHFSVGKQQRVGEEKSEDPTGGADRGRRRRMQQFRNDQLCERGGNHRCKVAREQPPRPNVPLDLRTENP